MCGAAWTATPTQPTYHSCSRHSTHTVCSPHDMYSSPASSMQQAHCRGAARVAVRCSAAGASRGLGVGVGVCGALLCRGLRGFEAVARRPPRLACVARLVRVVTMVLEHQTNISFVRRMQMLSGFSSSRTPPTRLLLESSATGRGGSRAANRSRRSISRRHGARSREPQPRRYGEREASAAKRRRPSACEAVVSAPRRRRDASCSGNISRRRPERPAARTIPRRRRGRSRTCGPEQVTRTRQAGL